MVRSDVGDEPIQSISTRIRLDGADGECVACGETIDAGERFKVAAVRSGGRIVHHDFCGADCVDNWSRE